MILILLATILLLAIAFFQVTQGLFSALIMAVLSIFSLALAVNYYEPLATLLQPHVPACAEAISLLVLFVVPLLVLRILADRYIGWNVVLGVWANRIGGGAMGLVTGLVTVGVLALILQMLPLGRSILMYEPYDSTMTQRSRMAPLCPDDFTLGCASRFSSQSLKGSDDRSFDKAHDNMVLELFAARNTAGKNGRVDAAPDALKIILMYAPEGGWGSEIPPNPMLADTPNKVVVVRTQVNGSAADTDGWFRLVGSHFRLVGQSGTSYYPLGYMMRSGPRLEFVVAPLKDNATDPSIKDLQLADLLVERKGGKGSSLTVDWVYRIPAEDSPEYMVFRRVSRVAVPKPVIRPPDLEGALLGPAPETP
ncbi:MAG: CvpA family protein [Phycisphaerae bacterium]|jgi:uncharacterized membrane protein required for colicin V production